MTDKLQIDFSYDNIIMCLKINFLAILLQTKISFSFPLNSSLASLTQ